MAARLPRTLTPSKGRGPSRGPAGQEDDERGQVFLPIVYDGLKGNPVDRIPLTPAAARALAIGLLNAADLAELDVTVRGSAHGTGGPGGNDYLITPDTSGGFRTPLGGPVRIIPVREV